MKDPVTVVTGITYDRERIKHWLLMAEDSTCPVTKRPLPRDSDMTPNITLRRLIQAWCIINANNGVDRIATLKSPLNRSHVRKLVRDLKVPHLCVNSLKKMEELANMNEKNGKCMVEAGVTREMVLLIVKCFKEGKFEGVEEAFRVLHLIWTPNSENKQLVKENFDFIESMIWALGCDHVENHVEVKTHSLLTMKMILEVVSSNVLERLRLDFFKQIVKILRERTSHDQQVQKAILHILIEACPWGRNRMKIVEAGAIFELIELELDKPEKKVTELIFCLLAHLCSCADGREQLLSHAGGVAMVSKRVLRVSPATDDRAIHKLMLNSRFCATHQLLLEMLRVGAVSKLCMVL
ncbi:E3 ubiquitin-protein ligase PUB24-like [Cornus florida]|uniref:E3 ubiquitin-protein ligase PUB24-like n=1 Tax=Cornus florida TaxID=4283 RepID=UPI00289C8CED|nr:E3 ubiquitin-protein ligase PUB24-like [Cornus florida]